MKRDRALYTTCEGESLHESLGRTIAGLRERGRPAAGLRFLPGAIFTDGERMYEVVYGFQSLGTDGPCGWVAGARTDWLDDGAPPTFRRYAYTIFSWEGVPRDGCIICSGKRGRILRLVKGAPRIFTS
jgi:hypothetical protein